MIFNIGDKATKLFLWLARTPLLFYPHYKYHLPLPSVMMIENTNLCNAECIMCPRGCSQGSAASWTSACSRRSSGKCPA